MSKSVCCLLLAILYVRFEGELRDLCVQLWCNPYFFLTTRVSPFVYDVGADKGSTRGYVYINEVSIAAGFLKNWGLDLFSRKIVCISCGALLENTARFKRDFDEGLNEIFFFHTRRISKHDVDEDKFFITERWKDVESCVCVLKKNTRFWP